jgi:hypothetical protein
MGACFLMSLPRPARARDFKNRGALAQVGEALKVLTFVFLSVRLYSCLK